MSIDNSVTNSTNNPASVWNHALSPKVRESKVPGGRTNSDCILILQNYPRLAIHHWVNILQTKHNLSQQIISQQICIQQLYATMN